MTDRRSRSRSRRPVSDEQSAAPVPRLTVGDLAAGLSPDMEVIVGGAGLKRAVSKDSLQRLTFPADGGKADWGGQVAVLWRRELERLKGKPGKGGGSLSRAVFACGAAAFVVPKGEELPPQLVRQAQKRQVAVLAAEGSLASVRARVGSWLRDHLSLEKTVHGVLLEVSGVGMLILGPSGIGKSESALELVMRGHRLVADDLIVIHRAGERRLVGRGAEMAGSHMEIRGLGIISVQDLFGVSSVLERKAVEVVVDLREWSTQEGWDRLGLEERHYELLGVKIPYLQIPVNHGRNMAVILEVAARNHLLKERGCFTARDFERDLSRRLALERRKGEGLA